MSLRHRRLIRQLRPDARPRPPEELLERLVEDIPSDLFSGEESAPRPVEGRRSALPWTVAASVLVVLLAGLVAVRFRAQLDEPAAAEPAAEQETRRAAASEDAIALEETSGALAAEGAQRSRDAEEERAVRRKLREDPQSAPSAPAPRPAEAAPESSIRSRQLPQPASPPPEEAEVIAVEGAQAEPRSLADEADEDGRSVADRASAAPPARSARAEEEERFETDRLQAREPRLLIEQMRWRGDRLEVTGTASVAGLLEARLVGTDRVEQVEVEAGRPFELTFEDAAGARSVRVRIVGLDARWEQEVPRR